MKKSIIALTLTAAMILPLLGGCGGQNQSASTTPTPSTQPQGEQSESTGLSADADTFPIVSEPVTLSVLALRARVEVEDWETNKVTQYWQDKTGVKFEWDTVTDADASKQKLSVSMASGDLPDIIISLNNAVTVDQAVAYGSQGLIIPLNSLVEKYGTNTQKLFQADSMVEPGITAPDGNMYFLPSYTSNASAHTSLLQRALINTTWLNNLGLSMPTTTEEYYEVLKAFQENDANGNGNVSDEIPLVTFKSNYTGMDVFLMNSFVYNSGKLYNWLSVENGTVTPAYTQEGWREGLSYMRKLYSEGLADKEIFLTKNDQIKMYTADEKGNRVGSIISYSYSSFIDLSSSSSVVDEFEFIPPLAGPTGIQQSPYVESWVETSFLITSSCETPEVAFRVGDAMMFDALSDPTLEALNGVYGPEGEGWAKAESGEVGLDGTTPAKYKWLFTFGTPNNLNWHEYGPLVRRSDWKLVMAADTSTWNQEAVLYKAAMNIYKPYATAKTIPATLMFETDLVAEISQLKETLNTYVEESMSKFVTGAASVETDWDTYLSELDKIGLQKYIQLYQEAYDRQFGN